VQFSYDDRSIVVVNDLQEAFKGLKVSAELLNLDSTSRFSGSAAVDVAADGVVRALTVPRPKDLSKTYFLRLKLEDASGQLRSSNLYWLSTQEDVLDWKKTEWYYTPTKLHSDLTALAGLAATTLAVSARFEKTGPEGAAVVSLENTGKVVAFQVRLKVVDPASGEEILPVYWDDNYFALFPGEKRSVRVAYPRAREAGRPELEFQAWNVAQGRSGK
jgi:exo-1,4-beta-D-glucosaminidase